LNAGELPLGRRGLMLVLSSPSGAGKSTISRALLASESELQMSVSVTTRPKRPGEIEGRDYYFTDRAAFDRMVANGELLEHAVVFGNSYGTPRAPVEAALASGRDVLFDVDWQGTQQLGNAMPADLATVFILPPNMEELHRRLMTRAADSDEVIAKRMAEATAEISHYREYDYVVINEVLETAIAQVRAILAAERLKRDRQPGLTDFIRSIRLPG
jgi:guanylate kinase